MEYCRLEGHVVSMVTLQSCLLRESSHGENNNARTCPTLFTKTGSQPKGQFADSCSGAKQNGKPLNHKVWGKGRFYFHVCLALSLHLDRLDEEDKVE